MTGENFFPRSLFKVSKHPPNTSLRSLRRDNFERLMGNIGIMWVHRGWVPHLKCEGLLVGEKCILTEVGQLASFVVSIWLNNLI